MPSKIPHQAQHDSVDCGAACLGMIAAHHGRKITQDRLTEICHITRLGISLFFLIFVALITANYYFRYDYTIKTSAIIDPSFKPPSVLIKIPASEIGEVFLGQEAILCLKNPLYLCKTPS